MKISSLPIDLVRKLRQGLVIPAMPLALDSQRRFDHQHQKALTRYYIDAGVGGVAVGVHTTQFAIRQPEIGLYNPLLSFVSETIDDWCSANGSRILKVAGICGGTQQAVREAAFAHDAGYHAGLLSLSAFDEADLDQVITHCKVIADILPLFGFYLQPAVGGRVLPYAFWRQFAEIENVLAIKIAPFNRYQTLDVVRAVCEAGRAGEIALYTGNDDNILVDLLTPFELKTSHGVAAARIVGGLLGHWAVWTRKAVELLQDTQAVLQSAASISPRLLSKAAQITEANAALFDAANQYKGCIPGIHYILRKQGILATINCLDPNETLSPGQAEEIERVCHAYPDLNDDGFVAENLARWLS